MEGDNQDFTDIIKLCQDLLTNPIYSERAKCILTRFIPDKIRYNILDEVTVAYNEYTFYNTVIEDVRCHEFNDKGYLSFKIEYLVKVNIYDCPLKKWIPQNKIFLKCTST